VSEALASESRRLPALPVGHFIEAGLLLAVGLIFVQRTPDLPVVRQAMTLSEVSFLLTAFVWLGMLSVARPKVQVYSAGLLGPFLLYVFAGLLSLLFSPYDTRDIDGIRELVARMYLMAFMLAVATYGTSLETYRRLLLAWCAAAGVVVGLLILHVLGLDVIGVADFEGRFVGLFRNPNASGGAIAASALVLLPIALYRGPAPSLALVRTFARWTAPGLLLATYLSDSQGAFLALVVGLVVWPLIRASRDLGPSLAILVMVTAVPLIVAVSQIEAVGQTLQQILVAIGYEGSGAKFDARVDMIGSRLRGILEHPVTGVGLSKARLSHTGFTNPHGSHFTILGITLETGVLGLAAVGTIFVAYLGIMRRNARLPLHAYPEWRALNEGLTMAFIGFLIFGLTHDVQTNRTMWLVATLTLCFQPAFSDAAAVTPAMPYSPSRLAWVLSHGGRRR